MMAKDFQETWCKILSLFPAYLREGVAFKSLEWSELEIETYYYLLKDSFWY